MRFSKAVRSGFSHYPNATGRASRSAFWWWLLFANVAIAAPLVANLALAGAAPLDGRVLWATRLLMLGLFVPTAALLVRRLHDTNRSARWLLLALVPVLGSLALMALAATPGTRGPNPYGAAPDVPGTVPAAAPAIGAGLADRLRGAVGT